MRFRAILGMIYGGVGWKKNLNFDHVGSLFCKPNV